MIDMTSQMMNQITNLNKENQRVSYQMSTGKILENGSDDAVLYAKTLDIESNLRTFEGLKEQINKTTAQNNVSDSTMDEIKKTIESMKVDILKSLNAGMDSVSMSAVAVNMEGLRENLITLSNTTVNGEYIFSGSDTTTKSFSKDVDFDTNGKVTFGGDGILRKVAVEPATYRERGISAYDVLMYNSDTAGAGEALSFYESESIIDANGQEWKLNAGKTTIQQYDKLGTIVSPTVELAVSNDGATPPKYTTTDAITGSTFLEAKHNYFDDLNILINALKGYSTDVDGVKDTVVTGTAQTDLLRTALGQTSQQYDASNVGHAELGGRNNIFNIALERIDTKVTHYNILMQEVGGADLSKLAMESKALEMSYQALYSTISKMNSLSLLNYIK